MFPTFTSLLISVTEACHVGCSHCGFIGSTREREAEPEEMALWISQACSYGIPKMIFTGGEPFERLEVLAGGVRAGLAFGVEIGVFTSSYWGDSRERAKKTLSYVKGVTHLYLSSDTFHQRRVPYQYVFNVIE